MMRRVIMAASLISLAAGINTAAAANGNKETLTSTRDAVEQSGIVGAWSTDCLYEPRSGRPGANVTIYAVPASGFPTRERISVAVVNGHRNELSETYEIVDARRVTVNEVAMKIVPVRRALVPFSQAGATPYDIAVPEKLRKEYVVVDNVFPDRARMMDYFAVDGSVTKAKNGVLWVPYMAKPTPWPGVIKWRSSGKETLFSERCSR